MCTPATTPPEIKEAERENERVLHAAKDLVAVLERYGVDAFPNEIIAAVSGDWKNLARAAHALHDAIAAEIN